VLQTVQAKNEEMVYYNNEILEESIFEVEKMTIEQFKKNLTVPKGRVDVVMDTDACAECDDQYAIAYMIKSKEKINVKAIYAAPFCDGETESTLVGMEKSYEEILKILDLMNEEELKTNVFKGADKFIAEETTPVISNAAKHLAELADTYTSEKPLYVIGIGAITNIASAILINPGIVEKIVVIWLGGHSRDYENTKEFNMMNDIAAARIVFSSGVPIVQLPCFGVVSSFSISGDELEKRVKGKNPLCDYLVERTIFEVSRWINPDCDWTRIIWDVTPVAWLLNDENNFMFDRIVPVRVPTYEGIYEEKESENLMCYVYFINRDELMRDMIEKITK